MKKILCFLTSFLFASLSLAAQEAPPTRDQGLWQTIIMVSIFLIFFYFILFRPEQRRRKTTEEMRNRLKKGDKVVAMGIVGVVLKVQEGTVILKMVDGSRIEVLKAAISDVTPATEEEVKKLESSKSENEVEK